MHAHRIHLIAGATAQDIYSQHQLDVIESYTTYLHIKTVPTNQPAAFAGDRSEILMHEHNLRKE